MAPGAATTTAKKYKLFSSGAAAGEKAPCAFFASPQGCRNGANCKFSHELVNVKAGVAAAPSPNGGGSVVSSESDDDDKVVVKDSSSKKKKQKKAKANQKKDAPDANPFLAREEQQETDADAPTAGTSPPPPPPPAAAASAAATGQQPSKSLTSSKWVPLHRSSSTESKKKSERAENNSDSKKKETINNNNNNSDNSNKKKNRRGKNSTMEDNPFVNPKGGSSSAKKVRMTEPVKESLETFAKEKTAPPQVPPPPPPKASTTTYASMADASNNKMQKSAPPTAAKNTSTSTTSNAPSSGIHPAFGSLNLPVAPFSVLANNTTSIGDDKNSSKEPKSKKQKQQQRQQSKEEEPLESGEEEEEEDQKPVTTKRQEPEDSEDSSNDDDDDDDGNGGGGKTDSSSNNNNSSSSRKVDPKKEKYLNGVWPESTAVGRKWLPFVRQTRQHFRYLRSYDFERFQQQDEDIGSGGGPSAWIRARPNNNNGGTNNNKKNLPAAIAIDCEMCETQDPVSKKRNPRALCRISVINAENDELLLDSLVKPAWPVINHRSWINGIAPQHLETVQFTLRHAQAFLMELCTDETVILGHAVHNDLAALQMEHYCVADSACLFQASDSERATVSLKDLALNILNKKMPETHDSVNDARVALRCLEHYMEKNGNVEKIVRSNPTNKSGSSGSDGFGSSTASFAMQLFVHRIPRKVEPDHLMKMFLEHSSVEPESVQDVDFPNPSNPMGKTIVTFRSQAHANLAFDTLAGKSEPDPSGRLQKKVFMKNGSYIRVRKMAYECKPQQEQESQQDSSPLKRKRSDSM